MPQERNASWFEVDALLRLQILFPQHSPKLPKLSDAERAVSAEALNAGVTASAVLMKWHQFKMRLNPAYSTLVFAAERKLEGFSLSTPPDIAVAEAWIISYTTYTETKFDAHEMETALFAMHLESGGKFPADEARDNFIIRTLEKSWRQQIKKLMHLHPDGVIQVYDYCKANTIPPF